MMHIHVFEIIRIRITASLHYITALVKNGGWRTWLCRGLQGVEKADPNASSRRVWRFLTELKKVAMIFLSLFLWISFFSSFRPSFLFFFSSSSPPPSSSSPSSSPPPSSSFSYSSSSSSSSKILLLSSRNMPCFSDRFVCRWVIFSTFFFFFFQNLNQRKARKGRSGWRLSVHLPSRPKDWRNADSCLHSSISLEISNLAWIFQS